MNYCDGSASSYELTREGKRGGEGGGGGREGKKGVSGGGARLFSLNHFTGPWLLGGGGGGREKG